MPFETSSLLWQVAIAIATGALIGLERERRTERKFAGLRTMAILCGVGPLAVFVTTTEGHSVFVALYLVLAIGIAFAIAAIRFSLRGEEVGFTTSVTVVIVAFLGILVGYGQIFESTSIAIVIVVLLSERERLHGYVDSLSDKELRDSLTLGALGFILYPILPAEAIDPWGIVVLRDVLLFAIFVLLIEFSSYVLMRQFGGSSGLAVTGLLAGGANSFAAAGVLAKLANRSREALDAASFAILLATFAMIVRNVGIAGVLAIELVDQLWQPAVVMGGVTLLTAGIIWQTSERHADLGIDMDSPFSMRSAVKFSLAYVGILVVSVGAQQLLGDVGLLATAFAGGLVSSAAVSVTAATVFNEGAIAAEPAVAMVVLGIAASLTSKIVLIEVISGEMRRRTVLPLIVVGTTGLLTVLAGTTIL